MNLRMDHVVLWVKDPLLSVTFYEKALGLVGVRVDEFRRGEAPFPSVRVSAESIIDLMPVSFAGGLDAMTRAEGSAGNKVNHVCLAMSKADYDALRARLEKNGITMSTTMRDSFGARGSAPEAFYFADPDGNVLEARYYA